MTVRTEEKDREYFLRRAREERMRAAACEMNNVALAHLKLAEEYDRRAGGISPAMSVI